VWTNAPKAARFEGKIMETNLVKRGPGGRIQKGFGAAFRELGVKCGAKRRDGSGGFCGRTAARGKRRCKLHGGAKGIGAPKGNTNALIHGQTTTEAVTRRKLASAKLKVLRALGRDINLFAGRVRPKPIRIDQVRLLAEHEPDLLLEYAGLVGSARSRDGQP
jgi:glucans biosynthesis protein